MLFENEFKNPKDAPEILEKIEKYAPKTGEIRIMEISALIPWPLHEAVLRAYCRHR